ncbi:hypothetical protein F5146DRAFT_25588 [Armillaria mellea]|nr:hypothetical protein F5146DRAFT_25588 [Armillaria mellea]
MFKRQQKKHQFRLLCNFFYEPRFGNLKFRLFKLHVHLSFLLRPFISKMPCHRSCKRFAPRPPPTYDEALHASSSLYLPIGEYAARYQPYSLSYRFEGEYIDVPVPQTPAIIPLNGRYIVPPHYDLDDYIGYESEETDEDEDDGTIWDDEDEDGPGEEGRSARNATTSDTVYSCPSCVVGS